MKTHNQYLKTLLLVLGFFTLQNTSGLYAQLVNIATEPFDPGNLGDTEPSIAVNPLNPLEIAVVTFSEGWSATLGAPVWKSTDGGQTWVKRRILPRPAVGSGGPGDQKVQFDRNGNLHIVELAMNISPPRCLVYRQTGDDTAPMTPGTFYGDDQPMLDIDTYTESPFAGNLYSPWLNFGLSPVRSMVTQSPDLGVTVNNVVAGNAAFTNRTTRSAVGPDGSAYIVFKTREGTIAGGFENAHFVVKRSDDGGVTWTGLGANGVSVHGATQMQTWFTSSWGNPAKGKVGRARSSDTWIATNPSNGDVVVVFCDRDASNFGQIFVTRSTDRGSTWSTPVRVTNGTRHSAFPEIAVTCNGDIGVLYIDYDDSGANTIFRHHFARSSDNGATWNDEMLQAMDPGPLFNAASGFLWGDYEGLTAHGTTFYGVFTGQSIGRTITQFDPIFFRRESGTPTTITCPANITTNNDPDLCSAVVTYPPPVTSSDCTVQSTNLTNGLASGSAFPVGVTLNRFVVTDFANLMASCQFTVTVIDNQGPTVTCPADVTVDCDTTPAGAGTANTVDNCDGSPSLSHTDVVTSGDCAWLCTIERTWESSDNQGLTGSCVQIITKNTLPLIEQALNADVTGDGRPDLLVLGTSNSTLTIPPGRGNCILQWFPHTGTTPTGLTFKKSVVAADCLPGTNPLDGGGHLANPLLAEALKLNLLVRLDPALGTKKLDTFAACTFAPIVLQALAPDPDVNELLRVTNAALGNIALQPHLPELLAALKCIADPLDVCD